METRKTLQFNSASFFQAERWFTVLWLAVCMLGAGISALAQRPRIIEFDARGAGNAQGSGLGTQAENINPWGAVAGLYADMNNVMHGFLRTPQGRLITFDAPGAGTAPGLYFKSTPAGTYGGQGTYAMSINPEGAIAGSYLDETNLGHGFLRAPDGKFTSFDDPDAGTAAYLGTFAWNINPAGVIAGNYWDAYSVRHGFVRTPHGKFANFDPSGSVSTFVCLAECINPAGAINGYYFTADGVAHGFVRSPDGKITEFDVPNAGTDGSQGQGTYSVSINTEGAVTGQSVSSDNVTHGFVRAPDGRITEFDVPGAGTDGSQYQGTFAEAINDAGAVTGQYIDANDVQHGFVRIPDGRITKFDAPDAGTATSSYEGTVPLAINAAGEITGAYFDSNYVLHGFLLLAGPR
ncbi:MAG: hypothetical protein ABSE93_29870 [Terriglobia bacterium]|jgi:hypothetical protein